MKIKNIFFVFFISLVSLIISLSLVSAINVEVSKKSLDEIYIKDLRKPIEVTLKIKNIGNSDYFEFYNLVGFFISPSKKVYIQKGEEKEINLQITPLTNILPERGFYTLPYFIKSSDGSNKELELMFKIVELKDVFTVAASDIEPTSTFVEVSITNKENVKFENVSARFSSPFFKIDKKFDFGPRETKKFNVTLDKEEFKDLTAGFYTIIADIDVENKQTRVEGIVRFVEKNIVTTTKEEFGFLVNTQIIEKNNEGNLVETSEVVVKKNVISRLFTSFSPEPDVVERKGKDVYYTWVVKVNPGETRRILVKTNWLFPFLIICFLILVVMLAIQYSRQDIVLKKRISFVRARGGEFALKVSILIFARKFVERVSLIDKLPSIVELYERFGGEAPTRVDKKNRRLEWNFDQLHPGEKRIVSYIVYSKIGVLGRFGLPEATAIYEREGNIKETESNVAFFVSEQRKTSIE
ncbi:MAG: hypothetical protein QXU40_01800 [Candidatus Pacearchaeota archaeon]